jgi:hypothetical protein
MFRWSVLLLALTLSAPTLWSAFGSGSIPLMQALIRFLIAMPVSTVMLMMLRSVTASYQATSKRRQLEVLREAQAAAIRDGEHRNRA